MNSNLAVIIPVWQRTRHIERVARSIEAATPGARIRFVYSIDDEPVRVLLGRLSFERTAVPGGGGERGDYARKINAGYRATTEPLLFTGADDLAFHPGWFEQASALIDRPVETVEVLRHGILIGPDRIPTIGVVGTNDLCNGRTANGTHSTHSLVARWYADQGGSVDQDHMIYDEGYHHDYCDDELVQTAMARGAYVHSGAVVEHLHPLADKGLDDAVYEHGRRLSRLSRRRFRSRAWLWEGRRQPRRLQRR